MHFHWDRFADREMGRCYAGLTTLESGLSRKPAISGRTFLVHRQVAGFQRPSKAVGEDDAEKAGRPGGQENSPRLAGPGKCN